MSHTTSDTHQMDDSQRLGSDGIGGGEELATEMNVLFFGRIPLDPRIVASGDSGKPFVESVADSPAARAFAAAVEPILKTNRCIRPA